MEQVENGFESFETKNALTTATILVPNFNSWIMFANFIPYVFETIYGF